MSSHCSECFTELYDLIRHAPYKLALSPAWQIGFTVLLKGYEVCQMSPAIPTSLNRETHGTFIQRQINSEHSLTFVVRRFLPNIPLWCALNIQKSNTLTLSYHFHAFNQLQIYFIHRQKDDRCCITSLTWFPTNTFETLFSNIVLIEFSLPHILVLF